MEPLRSSRASLMAIIRGYISTLASLSGVISWRWSVQVGDLVCHAKKESQIGIVVEMGKYKANGNIKILWCGFGASDPRIHSRNFIKLLNPS